VGSSAGGQVDDGFVSAGDQGSQVFESAGQGTESATLHQDVAGANPFASLATTLD
jgi:hypothetical protein